MKDDAAILLYREPELAADELVLHEERKDKEKVADAALHVGAALRLILNERVVDAVTLLLH